jgi:transcriptional regulator with XRE-family HTH domain
LERIDALIGEKGITRNTLAKEVEGLNHNSFNAWSKRGTIPSADIMGKIAGYFNVPIEYLLYGEGSVYGAKGLADRVNEVCRWRGVFPDTLLKGCGLSDSYIAEVADGSREPEFEEIIALADALNVSFDFLMGYSYVAGRYEEPFIEDDEWVFLVNGLKRPRDFKPFGSLIAKTYDPRIKLDYRTVTKYPKMTEIEKAAFEIINQFSATDDQKRLLFKLEDYAEELKRRNREKEV